MKKYTVMVIEDESPLLRAITMKLDKYGFETISCVSGVQALNYLSDIPEKPDVIWLDYYLKDLNGLEFMHKLTEKPDTKDIPVVVVSNSASSEKVNTMLGLGVKKYVLKADFSLDSIIKTIEKFIIKEKNNS